MSVGDLAERVAKLKNSEDARRLRNRAANPEFTAFVDDFKRVFGPGVKVKWVRWPDGREDGKRGDPGVPIFVPPKVKR